jgi:hypothetical protein
MVLELDVKKAAAVLAPLLNGTDRKATVRERLEAFAAAEGLQL